MLFYFQPDLLSAGLGLSGSFLLMADVITLTKDKIIKTAGTNKLMLSNYENETKPLLKRRIDTIFGGFFITASYLIQMLNTIKGILLFETPYDWFGTWITLITIFSVTYFIKHNLTEFYIGAENQVFFKNIKKHKINALYFSCLAIFIISIGLIYYSSLIKDWEQSLYLNIGTSLLCSLLFLCSVDFILKRNAKNDQKQRAALAFKRLKWPLIRHLEMFRDMYKASSKDDEFIQYDTFEEMFCEKYFNTIVHLNIGSKAPVFPYISWENFFYSSVSTFSSELNSIIDKFGMVLTKDELTLLEDIINSPLSIFTKQLPIASFGNKFPFYPIYKMGVKNYIILLIKLLNIINQYLDKAETIYKVTFEANTAPTIGESRIDFEIKLDPSGAEQIISK
ncbi:MAG: hypothetical protein H6Q74_1586 [Firmicutes bacterium]|nr:hypothetical protein [Bacillota bacterium]